jgi:hypothetical protein
MGNLLFWLGIGAAQKGAGSKPIKRRHWIASLVVGSLLSECFSCWSANNEAALGHGSDVVIGLGSRGAIGVNEQLFGADEQVRGQDQSD